MSNEEHGGIRLNFTNNKRNETLPDFEELLICSELKGGQKGNPKPLLANAITMLRYHPDWSGVLAFNEFSLYPVTKKPAPWEKEAERNWTDNDDSLAADWLQHAGILVSSKLAHEAVAVVARENSFHPVKDYLTSIEWDSEPRLDSWLERYLGAEDTPFVRAVGPRWLVSAVARIFRPGCQVDHTLLLEGPQGIQKSSAFRELAGPEWFTDHISDLGNKDSRIELHGKMIVELSELAAIRRSEVERVKAFLTARTDHFRPPYGRSTEDVPRSNIFAASTNDQTPFTDATGSRRFWPVRCGTIDIGALTRDRDQLWAEAYRRYQDGAVWWLDTSELNTLAIAEQEERYDQGVWDDVILEWTNDPKQRYDADGIPQIPIEPFDSTANRVTITDVLIHAIGKPLERCTQSDKNLAARCLLHRKWTHKQDWSRGPLRGKWFYFRPEPKES